MGPTEHPDVSRMTVVVDVEDLPLEQVTKQLNKLVEVLKVVELEPQRRGAAPGHADQGAGRRRHPQPGRSRRCRCSAPRSSTSPPDSLTIEATGNTDKLEALLEVLEPFGVKELVQSGHRRHRARPRSITDRALRSA